MSSGGDVPKNLPILASEEAEFKQIEDRLEPLLQVFNLVIFNQPMEYIQRIENGAGLKIDKVGSRIQVSLVVQNPAGPLSSWALFRGHDTFNDTIPNHLRLMIHKLYYCNSSVQTLLPHVEALLAPLNAKINWLISEPKLRKLFRFEKQNGDPTHSALEITLPSGNQYVLDATRDQYGYHAQPWLFRRKDYEDECYRPYRIAGEQDLNTIQGSFTVNDRYKIFADEMDHAWDAVNQLLDQFLSMTDQEKDRYLVEVVAARLSKHQYYCCAYEDISGK